MESLVYRGKRPISQYPVIRIKRKTKAGTVRHTSTNFFVVWKSSAGIFFTNKYSELGAMPVSSGEDITATGTVQISKFPAGQLGASVPSRLYSLFVLRPLIQSGAVLFHAQAYIPT